MIKLVYAIEGVNASNPTIQALENRAKYLLQKDFALQAFLSPNTQATATITDYLRSVTHV